MYIWYITCGVLTVCFFIAVILFLVTNRRLKKAMKQVEKPMKSAPKEPKEPKENGVHFITVNEIANNLKKLDNQNMQMQDMISQYSNMSKND